MPPTEPPAHSAPPFRSALVPFPSLWDAPTRSVSVVVPAYNEEERMPSAMEEMLALLKGAQEREP